MARALPRLMVAALAAMGAIGCATPGVVRVVEGRAVEGRFISEEAYALYARGAIAAAAKDRAAALAAFEQAAQADPESVAIWTRIGALRCEAGQADAADRAFAEASDHDPDFAPLAREKARCWARRGRAAEALAEAGRAAALDPDDAEAATLWARLLRQGGRVAEARRALEAFVARAPDEAEPWLELYELGRAARDEALAARAARRLAELGPGRFAGLAAAVPALAPLTAIDAALARGAIDEARRLALRARVPRAELTLRAAALGRVTAARGEAELVLGADPSNTSARIALAVAADLGGDDKALGEVMDTIPTGPAASLSAPSPLARLLFAELLGRRVGAEAARAWLDAWPRREAKGVARDALRESVDRRVRERLDPQSLARAAR